MTRAAVRGAEAVPVCGRLRARGAARRECASGMKDVDSGTDSVFRLPEALESRPWRPCIRRLINGPVILARGYGYGECGAGAPAEATPLSLELQGFTTLLR